MSHIHTPTGETAVVEINDQSQRFHYTWQTTGTYRKRYGCWSYHCGRGTRVALLTAQRDMIHTTGNSGLKVLSEKGDWLPIPNRFAEAGTAMVSAVVHPHASGDLWLGNFRDVGIGINEDMCKEQAWNVLLDHLSGIGGETPPEFTRLEEQTCLSHATVHERRRQISPDGWALFNGVKGLC